MKILYMSALLLAGCLSLSAQQVQWQKDLRSSTQDFLSGLVVTPDGQFLVSGSSIQPPKVSSISAGGAASQNNGYDFRLMKLNQQGAQLWERFYSGNNHDFLTATVATQEGGFLLAGTSYSSKSGDKKSNGFGGSDVWLMKIDEEGREEWQRTVGTSGNEEAKAVIQTADLGYFVAAMIRDSQSGYGSKDVWLLKLDKTGKPTREILIGGSGLDEVQQMLPTRDGGVLMGIYSRSGVFTENGSASSLAKNKKANKNKNSGAEQAGEEASKATLRTLPRKEPFFSDADSEGKRKSDTGRGKAPVSESPGGSSSSPASSSSTQSSSSPSVSSVPRTSYAKDTENYGEGDFWVMKLDSEGNLQWQKNFGGKGDDRISTLAASDTGFLIGGSSRSGNSGNKNSGSQEGTDLWVIALDENGNERFQKTYSFGKRDVLMSMNTISDSRGKETKGFLLGGYSQAEGRAKTDDETFWMLYVDSRGEEVWRKHIEGKSKSKEERLITAQLLHDGSYILAGTSAAEAGKENWKVVKLGDAQVENLIEKQQMRIYPNPVSEYCYVEIGFDFKNAVIELFDMSGRLLQSTSTPNRITKINTQGLAQGAYLMVATAHTEKETKTMNAKLIKK